MVVLKPYHQRVRSPSRFTMSALIGWRSKSGALNRNMSASVRKWIISSTKWGINFARFFNAFNLGTVSTGKHLPR